MRCCRHDYRLGSAGRCLSGVCLAYRATLAAHAAPRHLRLAAGYVFGFTGYVLGRLASATYDFPIGVAIVCLLAVVGAAPAVVLSSVVPEAG